MKLNNSTESPRYGCRQCGSVKLRGGFDTFQVFRAEGDVVVHLGSEFSASGLLELICYECGKEIEVDDLGEVHII